MNGFKTWKVKLVNIVNPSIRPVEIKVVDVSELEVRKQLEKVIYEGLWEIESVEEWAYLYE